MKNIVTYFIALVWFINGFYCKILNQIPRHEQIIGKIINLEYSRLITIFIGVLELFMVVWILSKYKSKLNAKFQVVIILIMNILEFILVPELLLWGKLNLLFAILFIFIIFYNECYLKNNENV